MGGGDASFLPLGGGASSWGGAMDVAASSWGGAVSGRGGHAAFLPLEVNSFFLGVRFMPIFFEYDWNE